MEGFMFTQDCKVLFVVEGWGEKIGKVVEVVGDFLKVETRISGRKMILKIAKSLVTSVIEQYGKGK